MAYKGQKVQKVMVQPIVSFLTVMKKFTIEFYSVEMATHLEARATDFDISFSASVC